MTKREQIMEAEVRQLLERVHKEQLASCLSEETEELQQNFEYLMQQGDTTSIANAAAVHDFVVGSAYSDGFIRGIRAGVNLANRIIGT